MGVRRPEPDAFLVSLRKQGLTVVEISATTNFSVPSIYRRLNPQPVLTCDSCGRDAGRLRGGLAPGVFECRACWKAGRK